MSDFGEIINLGAGENEINNNPSAEESIASREGDSCDIEASSFATGSTKDVADDNPIDDNFNTGYVLDLRTCRGITGTKYDCSREIHEEGEKKPYKALRIRASSYPARRVQKTKNPKRANAKRSSKKPTATCGPLAIREKKRDDYYFY